MIEWHDKLHVVCVVFDSKRILTLKMFHSRFLNTVITEKRFVRYNVNHECKVRGGARAYAN